MNIFQNIINKKRGHNFALSHYGTSFSTSKDYFFHVSDKDDLSRLTPRIPSYGDEYKLWFRSVDWGRLRKRTTKHANGWRVRLNPKKLRRKRQTRQETALI